MSVEGKVVIVTGAARGIGQEYVRALAAAGARTVAADVSDCSETIDLAKSAGGEALGVKCDVADVSSTQAMVAAASKAFGRVDALINNAALYGGLRGGRFETITEADWDAAMTINVKGIWNCCKSAVPALRAVGGGSIINIASLAATFGTPFVLHYTTSKAAVIGMTRGLARELGRDNIRVNAVAPSAVITEGTREFFANKLDKALEVVKSGQAIQRNLQPSDLSGTILWLVADTSAFVTGQTISVDGGTVMN
jgi:NAD(P)-dependent dehydrogenase (short-subunit alcohol dehydrogenase family)